MNDRLFKLHALANECVDPNWDGHGALPLTQLAVFRTEAFIRALPESVPLPEFAPQPDGSISLDWIQSRHRLFSVSVGVTDRLAFAWLDVTDKGHGVARFDGERIPPKILQGIRGIVNRGDAAVWFGVGC